MTTVLATLVYETHLPIQMTVADGTGIEKGAHLTLSDPLTAAAVTDSRAATAGIAHGEKIVDSGVTSLAVYRGGVFKVTASGAITVGTRVTFQDGFASMVYPGSEYGAGQALETAAAGETFLFELNPLSISQA